MCPVDFGENDGTLAAKAVFTECLVEQRHSITDHSRQLRGGVGCTPSQERQCHRVERADGGLIKIARAVMTRDAERPQTFAHLGGSFAGERYGQYSRGVGSSLRDAPCDAMGEYAGLSRTSSSVNDGGGRCAGDRSALVVVEIGEQCLGIHVGQTTTAVS